MPCTAERSAAAPAASDGPQPPCRQALAAIICACRSDGRFPARRMRWPLRRRLTRVARFRRNVAITPVDRMLPLKVQDALFFPRIPDGGIDPMGIALSYHRVRKERKS